MLRMGSGYSIKCAATSACTMVLRPAIATWSPRLVCGALPIGGSEGKRSSASRGGRFPHLKNQGPITVNIVQVKTRALLQASAVAAKDGRNGFLQLRIGLLLAVVSRKPAERGVAPKARLRAIAKGGEERVVARHRIAALPWLSLYAYRPSAMWHTATDVAARRVPPGWPVETWPWPRLRGRAHGAPFAGPL